jgi:hypothetical protein
MVVDEPDQVGVLAPQPKREDVALPHLVGRAALEEPRFGWVLRHLPLRLLHQPVLMQRPPHRLVTARQKQHPPQHLGDLLHAEVGMLLFQRGDPRFDCGRHLGRAGFGPADQWL